jgi:hypothetical protein
MFTFDSRRLRSELALPEHTIKNSSLGQFRKQLSQSNQKIIVGTYQNGSKSSRRRLKFAAQSHPLQQRNRMGHRSLLSIKNSISVGHTGNNEGFQAFSTSRNCGEGNDAAYGPCFASSFSNLEVSQQTTLSNPAFPGIPFAVRISKLDAYNQLIATDSSSIVQTQSSSNCTISGNSVATLKGGQVVISVSVKPIFVVSPGMHAVESIPYIFIKGIDSQADSLSTMISITFPIEMSRAICPSGYVLVFEQSQSRSGPSAADVLGICSECRAGTYSVDPLVGINPQLPSCFNCPSRGICKGGSSVEISLGTWKIIGGIYRLVGCPAGHQLVNSINGIFSHDIQNCLACASNFYIADSNNSNFSCQRCPTGGVCDGSTLMSAVQGAVWTISPDKGVYVLLSCPSGYEILTATQESQQCLLCPASYYCPGGTTRKNSCPGETFAPPGSNSSSACFLASLVAVSVLLPITRDDFAAEENVFRAALAAAAGVAAEYVVITGVSSGRRRSTSSSIQVMSAMDSLSLALCFGVADMP